MHSATSKVKITRKWLMRIILMNHSKRLTGRYKFESWILDLYQLIINSHQKGFQYVISSYLEFISSLK